MTEAEARPEAAAAAAASVAAVAVPTEAVAKPAGFSCSRRCASTTSTASDLLPIAPPASCASSRRRSTVSSLFHAHPSYFHHHFLTPTICFSSQRGHLERDRGVPGEQPQHARAFEHARCLPTGNSVVLAVPRAQQARAYLPASASRCYDGTSHELAFSRLYQRGKQQDNCLLRQNWFGHPLRRKAHGQV